jgi:HSP20 family molecular chaperone IbpA
MGQGKTFNYRKNLKEFAKSHLRERHLYVERITAVYGAGSTSTGEWTPAVDVYETRNSLVLVAEVAGLRQEDLHLEVSGSMLTLKGFRPFAPTGVSPENYYRMEFSYGNFERSFTLPCAVREENIKALLSDGVLTVTIPLASSGENRVTGAGEE